MTTRGASYAETDDAVLAARAQGDRAAFAELYERYMDKVYTYIYYRTGHSSLTEDIVSNTFLKALDHIGKFRPRGGGFPAWILRIARNEMVDVLRREKRQVPLEDEWPTGNNASPEHQAISREENAELRRKVEQLPPAQKEVIILKFSLGLGNKEIAQIIGKSGTAVSSLQHRALTTLREEVKPL